MNSGLCKHHSACPNTPVDEYLTEDGSGRFKNYFVPDVLPRKANRIGLVIVLESPHVGELSTHVPLSGKAGRDALESMLSNAVGANALGPFAKDFNLATPSEGMAVLNVSRVPLDHAAFSDSASCPGLSSDDWVTLTRLRKSDAQDLSKIRDDARRETARLLQGSFQRRVIELDVTAGTTVVFAGKFAQLYWRSMSPQPLFRPLAVPHPSYDQWRQHLKHGHKNLSELRRILSSLVASGTT